MVSMRGSILGVQKLFPQSRYLSRPFGSGILRFLRSKLSVHSSGTPRRYTEGPKDFAKRTAPTCPGCGHGSLGIESAAWSGRFSPKISVLPEAGTRTDPRLLALITIQARVVFQAP
jgi:hypothetical protein